MDGAGGIAEPPQTPVLQPLTKKLQTLDGKLQPVTGGGQDEDAFCFLLEPVLFFATTGGHFCCYWQPEERCIFL